MAMTSDDSEAKMTENCKAEIWPKNYFIRRVPSNIQKKIVRLKIVFALKPCNTWLRIPSSMCS